MAWTTPKTFAAAEVQTAADWNTYLRDALKWIDNGGGTSSMAGWNAYTPTWTNTTTNPVINNGTLTGTWAQIAKAVVFEIRVIMGSTTTYGSGTGYSWALPTTAISYGLTTAIGRCRPENDAVQGYRGIVVMPSTTTCQAQTGGTTLTTVNVTSPFTWGTADFLRMWGTYEAA